MPLKMNLPVKQLLFIDIFNYSYAEKPFSVCQIIVKKLLYKIVTLSNQNAKRETILFIRYPNNIP